MLSYLGFSWQSCLFLRSECYVKEVVAGLDLKAFGLALGEAYQQLSKAEHHLENCGFALDQPEGWEYYLGRQSSGRSRGTYYGDGHTSAITPEVVKRSEGGIFHFIFT